MAETEIRTLLLSDLVDSTQLVTEMGDARAAELWHRHDRQARDLLDEHGGREIDKTDGFLMLFSRPWQAVRYALAYHRALRRLSEDEGRTLGARVGIHLGEVVLRENPPEDVARGAKPLEVEGLAKPMAARLMSVAQGGQTLLTRGAFDLARRGAAGDEAPHDLRWVAHGDYLFKGVNETVEVFEVGRPGEAPLMPPPTSAKVRPAGGQEKVTGWRPAPGQEIPQRPNWRAEKRLGEGGFGEVWLGRHHKTGDRRVFKFCYDVRRLRSLQREITLFRLLKEELGNRQDIVPILDWNLDEAPYFIESAYTAGGDLAVWSERQGGIGQVPLATRLEIVALVAEALGAAHSVGVLHKDIKPPNVLIETAADGSVRPRLADFGIGLMTDRSLLESAGITMLGLTAMTQKTESTSGTPLYTAPELLEGKPPTVQADIYSLGVMLYQMAVGDLSRALAPGWRDELEDELLIEDIAAAVHGSPAKRLRDAIQLAERLRGLESRRAQLEDERRERERTARLAAAAERARRRWRWTAAALALLAAFSGTAILQERRTAREAERANREAEAARQVSEFLEDLFEVSDPGEARGNAVTAREILDRGAQKIAGELEGEPLTQARLMTTIGRVYHKLGLYPQAAPLLEDALKTREALLGADHLDVAQSLSELAGLYKAQGRYDEAEPLFERALQVRQEALGTEHLDVAKSLSDLGELYQTQGLYDRAQPLLERALAIREEALGPEHPDLTESLINLGSHYWYQGRYAEVEPYFERALAIREAALEPDHPEIAVSLNNLGYLYQTLGRYAEAGPLYLRALAIREKALGPDHPAVAGTLTNLAILYQKEDRHAAAEPLYERALAIREKALGPEHPDVARGLNNLAFVYRHQGRYDEAEPLYERALAMLENARGLEHPDVAYPIRGLAEVYAGQRRYAEAEAFYRRALAIWEQALGPDHPTVKETLRGFAKLLRVLGRDDEAAQLEARAGPAEP